MSTIAAVGSFVGPALGGVLLGDHERRGRVLRSPPATFLLSALQVATHPGRCRLRRERQGRGRAAASCRRRSRASPTILAEPKLRLLMGLYCAQTLVAGALGVLIVVASIRLLGLRDLRRRLPQLGVRDRRARRRRARRRRWSRGRSSPRTSRSGPCSGALRSILVGIFPSKAASLVLFAFIGVGDTLVEVAAPTLLQRAVPDEVLGRVFGVVESLIIGAMGIGAILAPAARRWTRRCGGR